MITKQFKDVVVGEKFMYNGLEYERTADVRVSCCKILNAVSTTNPNAKIQIQPLKEVQVNG